MSALVCMRTHGRAHMHALTCMRTRACTQVNEAKEKFARIALEEIARKEAKLGFELDNEAKSAIIQLLRSRYCGKDGLIGPC